MIGCVDDFKLLAAVVLLRQEAVGDLGRLEYIQHAIEGGQKIYETDRRYVQQKYLQLKNARPDLFEKKTTLKERKKPNMQTCASCNKHLALDDRVVRQNDDWFHSDCFTKSLGPQLGQTNNILIESATKTHHIPRQIRKKQSAVDPVLVGLAATIFALLIFTAYSLFSYLSVIALSLAALMVFYQITTRADPQSQYKYGRRGASLFSIAVMVMPFALGTVIAYDGYASGFSSALQTVFIWGLTLSFWQTMLFVPLAIRSIAREDALEDPPEFPKMSILVPAYNEEKVIRTTIESLLATDYPDKEIIAIDDGSKDGTFAIMSEYKDKIKVLHKENGGKASALNMGMLYSTGSIIVILDADTIIGYSALKQIAKSFTSENVAAVAGNIKIRNRINTLTWCQALEYLSGIQIMRRGLDYFGAITIVPGALGAFKKSKLEEAGAYHKETLVEDFDATMKVLRSGMIVSGSNRATAYTQGPHTLWDFYKQRKRWYRGNLQVLRRHSDVLFNPRFGYLQKFAYPLMAIHMLLIPSASLLVLGFTVYQLVIGNYLYLVYTLGLYILLQHLLSAMAVRMDKENKRLVLYSTLLVIGYKQLMDMMQLKAVIEEVFKLKAKWTSAQRVRQ
jgi:cellulose synthase/poly-beta-1,6-N-acetylglucosamine synthase-like glycosyltransferase